MLNIHLYSIKNDFLFVLVFTQNVKTKKRYSSKQELFCWKKIWFLEENAKGRSIVNIKEVEATVIRYWFYCCFLQENISLIVPTMPIVIKRPNDDHYRFLQQCKSF